jgi:hypothetical protein
MSETPAATAAALFEAMFALSDEVVVKARALKNHAKELEKMHKKVSKEAEKKERRKNPDAPKEKKGFTKELPLPANICEFIQKAIKAKKISKEDMIARFKDVKPGDMVTRVDVTNVIHDYIKTNDLHAKDSDDKRSYAPDAELKKLFKIKAEDPAINFHNFQQYVSRAYGKDVSITGGKAKTAKAAKAEKAKAESEAESEAESSSESEAESESPSESESESSESEEPVKPAKKAATKKTSAKA